MFSSFLISFCAACVFIGALYMLCPDGVMNKSVKYILGLCFIVTVIASAGITAKMPDIDFTLPETVITTGQEMDIASAKYVYARLLEANGIDFSEIEVCTDKTADGSIIINKVIIHTHTNADTVLSCLGEAAKNYEVEIINE